MLATTGYDPWGVPQQPLTTPFGVTGELHAQDRVYLRARWYAPGNGTLTSRDPFAGFPTQPSSLHPYQDAYSAPTTWVDPTGENPIGVGGVSAACLAFIAGDGPFPVGAAACVVLLIMYGVGLTTPFTLPHTGSPLPPPPPLAAGPPATSWDAGDACVLPGGTTLLPPDPGIWRGPSFVPPPWPNTTGAPLPPVQAPVVVAATYLQHDGRLGARFDPRNAHPPVKLGYTEHLRHTTPPGISWLDDQPSWLEAGLVSFETASQGFWPTFHEIIKHTHTIHFVVDGMDVFTNPQRLRGNQITHQEMDAIIRQGYVEKLHLWQNGQELPDKSMSDGSINGRLFVIYRKREVMMAHRWEHGEEYQALKSAFRRAQQEGNHARCAQLRPRIAELDGIMWQSITAVFAELAPYQSVVDALRATAQRLGVPFPDVTEPRNRTGDGQFNFLISDDLRTVQIWPMESRGYYTVELFDYADNPQGDCYRGQTPSLEQATRVLSRWFVERAAIADVHTQCPWMSREPFRLTGPRLTVE